MKIKVLFQLNQLGYGGTEKAILSFIKHLNPDKFDSYVFCYDERNTLRYWRQLALSFTGRRHKKRFDEKYVQSFSRSNLFNQILAKNVQFGRWPEFKSYVELIKPNIIHFNRGTEEDFYTQKTQELGPQIKLVETNIFSRSSNNRYLNKLDKIFFVSNQSLAKANWHLGKGEVLYNPIENSTYAGNLRKELSIPNDAIVIGQIGRPNLFQDSWVYNAFRGLKSQNVFLICLGCTSFLKTVKKNNDNIRLLEATTDSKTIHKFFNSLDILIHRRLDGESFGMNIAEAMMHGIPILTHRASVDNAQEELISNDPSSPIGLICDENDPLAYAENLKKLVENAKLRSEMGLNAQKKANSLYKEDIVTRNLEEKYINLVSK